MIAPRLRVDGDRLRRRQQLEREGWRIGLRCWARGDRYIVRGLARRAVATSCASRATDAPSCRGVTTTSPWSSVSWMIASSTAGALANPRSNRSPCAPLLPVTDSTRSVTPITASGSVIVSSASRTSRIHRFCSALGRDERIRCVRCVRLPSEKTSDISRARSPRCDELRAHRAGERVDDEEQPLGILEPVLDPLERRVGQRPVSGLEEPAIVLGSGAMPEPDPSTPSRTSIASASSEPKRTAGLDAEPLEQRGEMFGGRARERAGAMNDASVPGLTMTTDAGFDALCRPRLRRRRASWRRRRARRRSRSRLPRAASLGEQAAVETARVAPHESTFADGDARRDGEQTGDEISGEVRAGRPARTPETDVAHDS